MELTYKSFKSKITPKVSGSYSRHRNRVSNYIVMLVTIIIQQCTARMQQCKQALHEREPNERPYLG